MFLSRRTPRRSGQRLRAVEFIEFVIMLPFFLFFITFAVDMGRLTMLQAAMQVNTQQVARSGAQIGGWDFLDSTNCAQAPPNTCRPGDALGLGGSDPWNLMVAAVLDTPLLPGNGRTGELAGLQYVESYVGSAGPNGTTPWAGNYCTATNGGIYVVAKTSYDASNIFLTPGLYKFVGAAIGNWHWTINSTAVARVDVCH